MTLNMIIEFVKVCELAEIARNAKNNKKRFPFLPITEIRANAQSKNPVADKDDFGLIVAYSDDVCVGYLGLLPCLLRKGDIISKVYAFTAFFVDSAYRKLGVANKIMEYAFTLNYDFFYSGYTEAFYRFSIKNPQWFKRIGDTHFLQINLDLILPIFATIERLRREDESFWSQEPFSYIARAILFIIRRLSHKAFIRRYYDFFKTPGHSKFREIKFKSVSRITPLSVSTQELPPLRPYFYRDIKIINWMIENPWISEAPSHKSNYFFSNWRQRFRYLAYELHDEKHDSYLGYVVFSLSTRGEITTLTILDSELVDNAYRFSVLDQALKIALEEDVDKIITPDIYTPVVESHSKLCGITIHKTKGNFLAQAQKTVFPAKHKDLILQYCEGDIPFS